jgi:hypothetical protein
MTFILDIFYLCQGSPMVISMVAGLLAETGRIQVRLTNDGNNLCCQLAEISAA